MPHIKREIPHKCSIKDCSSTHKTHSIFKFPLNEQKRKKWVKVISYSNPEFGEIEDNAILKLGVCEDHFTYDQFYECGKKKRHSYPNKITQQEVLAGLPITSIDSESDGEGENSKRMKPSTQISSVKKDILDTKDDICRLCLATDVKMFSLNTEPVKQYYQFIEPCIDELDILTNNNFPTTVCYLCANALKKCYEFGRMCSQSQSVLMEFHLIYSKIKTKEIREYDKSNLPYRHNLTRVNLPNILVEDSKDIQHTIKIVSNNRPLKLKKVDAKEVFSNVVQKEAPFQLNVDTNKDSVSAPIASDLGSPSYSHEVEVEDDRMSVEYLDQEVSENELDFGVESVEDINLPTKATDFQQGVTIDESALLTYGHSDLSVFGSLSFEENLGMEPSSTKADVRRTKDKVTLSTAETDNNDIIPASAIKREDVTQGPLPATYNNTPSTSFTSPSASKPAKDDVLFVDVNVAKDPPKNTPNISQSQIDIIKKSVYKSHGEVEVKRIFYQGDDIHVLMVNAENKHVQLMLSRTDNLKTTQDKPKKTQTDIVFNKNCWEVKTLSKESQWILIQNRKQLENYRKAPFKCKVCFRWFQFGASFNAHMELHNPSSGNYCCQVCRLHFDDSTTLQKHSRTHTKQYSCRMCPAVYYTITPAKEHQNLHAFFQCPVCNQQFRLLNDYHKHVYIHKSEKSNDGSSTIGDLQPVIKYDMDRKMQPRQPQKWKATCCDITFVNKASYKRHYITKHPEQNYPLTEEGVICELCGALIHTEKSLLTHLEMHNAPKEQRLHKCVHCNKSFRYKHWLQRHMLSHTNAHPFTCSICNKSFRKKGSLVDHALKCNTAIKPERPFACHMCDRRFFKNCTLKAHVLGVHMGIKQNKQKEFRKEQMELEH